jgi:imidazolonepropionase-like amidohydrolase
MSRSSADKYITASLLQSTAPDIVGTRQATHMHIRLTFNRLVFILVIMLGCACQQSPAPSLATVPFAADSGSLAIRCGTLIDGLADDPIEDRLVIIRDGRFAEVRAGASKAPLDLPFLDLQDHTCLPGLIDTHTHIGMLPKDADDYRVYLRRTPDDTRELAARNAATTLLAGFTTIRNVADYLASIDREMRDRIRSGEAMGPRIQAGGFFLTIPHGGGDLYIPGVDDDEVPGYYREGVSHDVDELRENAQRLVDGGADMLKIIASGAVFAWGGIPGAPELSEDEIRVVVEVAHAAGLRVSAHAHGAQSIKDAIRAGVDAIEHASLADDEAIAMAAEHGVAFSMDVYNGTYTAEVGPQRGWPDEFLRKNDETTEAQRVVFEKAYALGVPILYGTDAGVSPHGMNARQFEVMVERGMRPMDAIRAASSVAALHMDWEEDVGAIEPGRFGDLIAVHGNPLDDIGVLQDVRVVVKGGLVFRLPTSR